MQSTKLVALVLGLFSLGVGCSETEINSRSDDKRQNSIQGKRPEGLAATSSEEVEWNGFASQNLPLPDQNDTSAKQRPGRRDVDAPPGGDSLNACLVSVSCDGDGGGIVTDVDNRFCLSGTKCSFIVGDILPSVGLICSGMTNGAIDTLADTCIPQK